MIEAEDTNVTLSLSTRALCSQGPASAQAILWLLDLDRDGSQMNLCPWGPAQSSMLCYEQLRMSDRMPAAGSRPRRLLLALTVEPRLGHLYHGHWLCLLPLHISGPCTARTTHALVDTVCAGKGWDQPSPATSDFLNSGRPFTKSHHPAGEAFSHTCSHQQRLLLWRSQPLNSAAGRGLLRVCVCSRAGRTVGLRCPPQLNESTFGN